MAIHTDYQLIRNRFVDSFKEIEGKKRFMSWVEKRGLDISLPFPEGKEKKEFRCKVKGFEIKELEDCFHVEGLIATSHIDLLAEEGIGDMISKETLESFAKQMNSSKDARVMGVHHSEGRQVNAEYFGEADIENYPAKVVPLNDGEWGLYVDTKLLKDDPETPKIIEDFRSGELHSFSITYDTDGFMTTDFDRIGNNLVRVLNPDTRLFGYTAASNPVNPNAVAVSYGFKEFKELVVKKAIKLKEVKQMSEEEVKKEEVVQEEVVEEVKAEEAAPVEESNSEDASVSESEQKEFKAWKAAKVVNEQKEILEKTANKIADKVLSKIEVKEKVLKDTSVSSDAKELSLEIKEFNEVVANPGKLEIKEQFRRAAAACDSIGLDWKDATTSAAESREYKSFGVNGRLLEYKGLGITTNQNTDTDYLQSSAELQDMYDPVIYNALNQATVTWNLLAKDDYSAKGNNQVQFTLKIAANASAAFYTGNSVATGNVTRLKYQTKFKKIQVGVSVDGDMIAAARGGPVSDVFAQEVMDSTMDMLAVLNTALFAEVGLETAAGVIGFEYITDSAGNTTLYNITRSAANKLAPDSASDTYINGSSAVITMTNLRAALRQPVLEGGSKSDLVFITNPVQADLLRGKQDDARRYLSDKDTKFGFSTDLFVDGVPVFEDKDCNSDDWFLVDLSTHRVAIWVPATIERLGKNADSEDAFIKMYLATYNRAPRRMVQIYGNATS